MKLASIISIMVLIREVQGFVPGGYYHISPQRETPNRQSSVMEMAKNSDGGSSFWGTTAALIAAMTLTSQVAVATVSDNQVAYRQGSVFMGQPSTVLVSVETMDFSLPSYESATKNQIMAKPDIVPSFNPFNDFQPKVLNDEDQEKKADEKAEREARRLAEREQKAEARKQAALDRQRSKDEAAAAAAAVASGSYVEDAEKETAGGLSFSLPDVGIPEISVPTFEIPKFDLPKSGLEMPEITIPDMPKFEMPKFDMPDMPKIDMPDMPKVDMPDMPNMDMPDMPKLDIIRKMEIPKFDLPKMDMPDMPKMDMPDMPKMDMPKMEIPMMGGFNPFGGDRKENPTAATVAASQEERDQLARESRQVFLDADKLAREAEEAARQVRLLADEKLKLARLAKDEACKTRVGGKWICLRNPFTAGY